jgi:hypothetical protein
MNALERQARRYRLMLGAILVGGLTIDIALVLLLDLSVAVCVACCAAGALALVQAWRAAAQL